MFRHRATPINWLGGHPISVTKRAASVACRISCEAFGILRARSFCMLHMFACQSWLVCLLERLCSLEMSQVLSGELFPDAFRDHTMFCVLLS